MSAEDTHVNTRARMFTYGDVHARVHLEILPRDVRTRTHQRLNQTRSIGVMHRQDDDT